MIVLKRTINWDGGTALTNVATFCQYAHISIGTPIFISVRINVIEMQDKQMESCKIVSNIFLFSSEPFSLKRLNLFRFECTHEGALCTVQAAWVVLFNSYHTSIYENTK